MDYGDLTPVLPLTIAADKSFVLTHVYRERAPFRVQVAVTDSLGATGRASFLVDVHRTPLIFVPGLLGSELVAKRSGQKDLVDSYGAPRHVTYEKDQVMWPPSLANLLLTQEDLNILRFEGGRPITDLPDDIVPSGRLLTLPLAYGDIVPFFEAHGYRENVDLFAFAYDWRYPVESHAAALDARIAEVLAATGSPSVDVVAHSMGTQVARAYLSLGSHISSLGHVILAGAPSLGTPKGSYALIQGLCFPLDFDPLCRIDPHLAQYLLRTMPGVVEMGVSPAYYDLFDGRDGAHPVALEERLGIITVARRDYLYLHDLLLERHVPETLIADAEAFHRDDLTWLSRTSSAVTLLAGTGDCTLGTIIKLTTFDLIPTPRIVTRLDSAQIDGDGTVVRQSASLEDAEASWSHAGGHRVVYRQLPHFALASNAGLPTILGLLRNDDVSNGEAHPPFICFNFSVHSPAEIVLTDGAGRRVGSADGKVPLLEVPTARYDRIDDMKVVTMTAPGAYTATLRGTADGDATVRVRWIASGLVTREAVYRHVPTTPRSLGSMAFDTGAGVVGALTVDLDGDGTTDVTIRPDLLDGATAADTTAPRVDVVAPRPGQAVVGAFRLDWTAVDAGAGIGTSFAVVDRGTAVARIVASPGAVELPPGPHVIEVFAEDRAGNAATAKRDVVAYVYSWLAPVTVDGIVATTGRTIPLRFVVEDASGASVDDASASAVVRDGAGAVVVGPIVRGETPADIVFVGSTYHVNLSGRGLTPGIYTIEVSFDSSLLTGTLRLPLVLR